MVLSQLARTKPIQIRSSPTWNEASDWRPLQRSARSASQAPLFHSQPRSNSLVSLLTSLFHSIPTSLLYLNHVSITFAPFATSDQFLVKAPPISSPALLSLPGWTMPTPVCLASRTRICLADRGYQNTLRSGSYILQTKVQHSPPFETPPLASSLSSDPFQNCSPYF